MKFVIIHGAFGGPDENWFPQLKESLESLGQKVLVPKFPVENWDEITKNGPEIPANNQTLNNWLSKFEEIYPEIKDEKKLVFIGHSLGPVFILHLAAKYKFRLDCGIFVIPFLSSLKRKDLWQFDHVNSSFYKTDFDFNKIRKLIPLSYVLYSSNDPYVDRKYSVDFASRLGSSLIEVAGGAHLNSEVNLNEFPLILELCKSRLDLSLYQKYLAHRKELYTVNYTKGKSEEIIYIKPEEIFDEGFFHFRNLRKSGFCTFYTGLKFWDTQNKYYEEARKAARRMHNLTRVFIIDQISDFERENLKKQINLDLEAKIKVYFCLAKEITNQVPVLDFGIWDEDYLCVIDINKSKNVNEVKLSSRKNDIQEALKWQKIILEKSKRIEKPEDIATFIAKYG